MSILHKDDGRPIARDKTVVSRRSYHDFKCRHTGYVGKLTVKYKNRGVLNQTTSSANALQFPAAQTDTALAD
jgi:hypothetical protein